MQVMYLLRVLIGSLCFYGFVIGQSNYCSLLVTRLFDCFQDDSLGADSYWAAGLHLYTPLPFRPGRGGLGDYIKTHFFLNCGNLMSLDSSMIMIFILLSDSGNVLKSNCCN